RPGTFSLRRQSRRILRAPHARPPSRVPAPRFNRETSLRSRLDRVPRLWFLCRRHRTVDSLLRSYEGHHQCRSYARNRIVCRRVLADSIQPRKSRAARVSEARSGTHMALCIATTREPVGAAPAVSDQSVTNGFIGTIPVGERKAD